MLKPINDYILVELESVQEKTCGGVYLHVERQRREQRGKVIAIGNLVPLVIEKDMIVQWLHGEFKKITTEEDDKEYALVSYEKLIGYWTTE